MECRYYKAHRQSAAGPLAILVAILLSFVPLVASIIRKKTTSDIISLVLGVGALLVFVLHLIPVQVLYS